MTGYDDNDIGTLLDNKGELIVTLESDAYDEVELHKHDTAINNGEVYVNLSDGSFSFHVDSIESVAWHQQSMDDIGL